MSDLEVRTTAVYDGRLKTSRDDLVSLPHSHAVQFYYNDSSLFTAVAEFIGPTLQAGSSALVIATEPHRQGIAGSLQRIGIDVNQARSSSQLTLLDARETLGTFMTEGRIDRARFMSRIRATIEQTRATVSLPHSLCVYGEMVDVLWKDNSVDEALELEDLWNELGRHTRFDLLCAYSMGNFFSEAHTAVFDQLCSQHTHVVAEPAGYARDANAYQREAARLRQRTLALENEIALRKKLEHLLQESETDRRNAEDALRELERRNDSFLATLAHDLRGPLGPIATTIEILRFRVEGREDVTRQLESLTRQVQRITRVIDDQIDGALGTLAPRVTQPPGFAT